MSEKRDQRSVISFQCAVGIGCLTLAMLMFAGCGRKGPPITPRIGRIAAVNDLTVAAEGCTITLHWSLPDSGEVELESFIILRAERPLDADSCPDCASRFSEAGRVYLNEFQLAGVGNQVLFSESVPCGFEYTYKIVGVVAAGDLSPDSNIARVVLPREEHNDNASKVK